MYTDLSFLEIGKTFPEQNSEYKKRLDRYEINNERRKRKTSQKITGLNIIESTN